MFVGHRAKCNCDPFDSGADVVKNFGVFLETLSLGMECWTYSVPTQCSLEACSACLTSLIVCSTAAKHRTHMNPIRPNNHFVMFDG